MTINDSAIYPGTENEIQVYVPMQYDPAQPACLLIKLDGFGAHESAVIDDLVAEKSVPVMIAIGISPGTVWRDSSDTQDRRAIRHNRSYEFDSVNNHLPDFVLNEVLPAVQRLKTRDGRLIHFSSDGNDRATMGISTGAIGAFTLAWCRPDQFARVYAIIGTFVSMRGGHEYPALIRKTEPKPIRIFMEDGSDDVWNPLFGSWFEANLHMESALSFSGYDVAHVWGTHGHNGEPGRAVLPDVLRWLWRDYPSPIKAGSSHNSTLQETLIPDKGWEKIPGVFRKAAGLASNHKGEVYWCDAPASAIYFLRAENEPAIFLDHCSGITGLAFGPEGQLYGTMPEEKKILSIDPQGNAINIAENILSDRILATHNHVIYAAVPGENSNSSAQIWSIQSCGKKRIVLGGIDSVSGMSFSPDGELFYAAERGSKWVYSHVVRNDESFAHRQPYYWLHMTDLPNNSGAEDIAVDNQGNLYAATRMGIQICDQNGRVRAILPLPPPSGPVLSLCFGGENFDTLYATDGKQVFHRKLKISGCPPWKVPSVFPSQGKF